MAFNLAVSGNAASSSDYNQIAGYFNGSGSVTANPIKLITLNDAANWVLQLKNLDTINCQVLQILKYNGVKLGQFDTSGFRYSSDGSNESLTPVSISQTETVTGAKTFSAALAATSTLSVTGAATLQSTLGVTGLATLTGGASLGSRLLLKRATSTASAGSLTLPTDGNIVPITGTTTITGITAVTSHLVFLEFQSTGCKVSKGSTLRLDGDFVSGQVGAILALACDGTNWNEVGRQGAVAPGAVCAFSGQTLTDNAADTVATLAAASYDSYGIKSGNTLVVPWTGKWRIDGSAAIQNNDLGSRHVTIYKNSSSFRKVAAESQPPSGQDWATSWSLTESFTASDVIDVRFAINGVGSNLSLRATSQLGIHFVGL